MKNFVLAPTKYSFNTYVHTVQVMNCDLRSSQKGEIDCSSKGIQPIYEGYPAQDQRDQIQLGVMH
jgi:hypothetical protein